MNKTDAAAGAPARLPEQGMPPEKVWAAMEDARKANIDWRDGRAAPPVYFAGEDIREIAKQAYESFFSENPIHRYAFPSLKRFEEEILQMTAGLLHNERAAGSITSGGSESIMLAVKGARDRARAERPEVREPEMVVPTTAHPAFTKAAQYLGLNITRTPLDGDFRVDLAAYRAAITKNTVLLVGSAPEYPFGIIDPIAEMAALAAERGINFHSDFCLGSFFLPFAEQLEYPVTPGDFRVPGVSSVSADLHKYGYAARGASTVIWRHEQLQQYQWFEFDEWPSGFYRTPGVAGTRPPGAIAAAWAVLHYMGVNGYRAAVDRTMRLTRRLQDGIRSIRGLQVFGNPAMCVFAYGSLNLDIYAVADGLEERGWSVSRGKDPDSIHVMIFNTPAIEATADEYLQDLEEVTERVRRGELRGRRDLLARYG